MKTRDREEYAPKALREVWEWKDAVYQETKHLSTKEALDYILKQGGGIARQLNLPVASFPRIAPVPVGKVAEAKARYSAKRKK